MSRFRRLSAALAAALLLFSTQADVYASAHCAHHAAEAPAPSQPSEHSHHSDQTTSEESASGHDIHGGACTCLGMCAAAAPIAVVGEAHSSRSFGGVFDSVCIPNRMGAVLPRSNHHLIPFATAPPFAS